MDARSAHPGTQRRRLDVRGQVQGVGFRPFVHRLATARGLGGFVANNANGALIEIEGDAAALRDFEQDLHRELPPLARIVEVTARDVPPRGERSFVIRASDPAPGRRPEVTPDAATCPACRRELFDAADRRHGYPFINCTNCGPRYSIIRDVPYDRPQTTMAAFTMCPACAGEYSDPADRRFHAQPNACAACGPQLRLVAGGREARGTAALRGAAELLRGGGIVAVKGLGGFHLACRADDETTVRRLRARKLRDGKPLAIMVASLAVAERVCALSAADRNVLQSPAAPIVLAPQRSGHGLALSIAPGARDFGVLLPYTPLHHLLLAAGFDALVMTSANLAGQPLTYRDDEALCVLADVADGYLLHDREIFRPIDDSVVFTLRGAPLPIRRARGYAPQPIRVARCALPDGENRPAPRVLAVGGDLKSAVCLLCGHEAIVSEHLGDLGHPDAYRHFVAAIDRLHQLFAFAPDVVACDLHPQYLSTGYAEGLGRPIRRVQHHHAHIASVMAEHGRAGPIVGLSCDGTGYGTDGAIWGGEVLVCERDGFERRAHLAYFPLVGGDAAAVETWRPAAALVRAAFGPGWRAVWDPLARQAAADHAESEGRSTSEAAAPGGEVTSAVDGIVAFERQVAAGWSSVPTSSLGRVFDAVAWILGLCARNRHEAEAALAVEAAASRWSGHPATAGAAIGGAAAGRGTTGGRAGSDELAITPIIQDVVQRRLAGEPVERLAARFHEAVAVAFAAAAECACAERGIDTVALAGGCFANRLLLERVIELLEARRRRVLFNRAVPAGDGGLALGQAFVAAWQEAEAGRPGQRPDGHAGGGAPAGAP